MNKTKMIKLHSLIPTQSLKEVGDEKDTKTPPLSKGAPKGAPKGADPDAEADIDATDPGNEESDDKDLEDTPKTLDVTFNLNKVRKYNSGKRFQSNKGVVTSVSKEGLQVTLPDETILFVNFEDIL